MADAEGELVKLLTIGDSGKLFFHLLPTFPNLLSCVGVGKSWLLLRWAGEGSKLNKNQSAMPTIGIDFKMKTVMIEGKRYKVQIVSSQHHIA